MSKNFSILPLLMLLVLTSKSNDNYYEANQKIILSLENAHEYAIAHNASMQDARIDAKIAERQIAETRAIGLPQVNASAGYQYYFEIPTSLVPAEFFGGQPGEFAEIQFGTEQNLSASLNINQLIFDGSYFVGLKAAKIFREVANKNVKKTKLEVIADVSQTYFLALVTRENIRIIKENIDNMNSMLLETKAMYDAGFTDQINKDQLQLAVSRLKNTLSNFERQKVLTDNLLKFQIGMDLEKNLELSDKLEELLNSLTLEILRVNSFNIDNHIDYQIMQSMEAMQEMNLKRERTAFYPNISGNYVYQESAMRNEFSFLDPDESWFPTTFFGININIPIFSSGMRSARVQQARLELDRAQIATRLTAQSVELQIQEAKARFNNALEKYQNDKDNLKLAEKIFEKTVIMHNEGLASSLELTQANDQVLETQSNYLQSVFELLNAKSQLDKAMGTI